MPDDASISRVHTLVTSVINPASKPSTRSALGALAARPVPTSRCPPPRPTSTSTSTSTSATAAASRVHRARPTTRRPPRATTRATPTPTTRDSACSTSRRRAANSSSSPSTRRATTATATASDDARRREYTAVEALDHVGFGKFQIRALCFVGFAWAADAMEMMLLSFIGPAMRCEFGVSSDAEGALTSVVFVGMMLGAPAWGVVSDARGRKPALLFSATTTLAAGIGSALGGSFGSVLFFRFVVGVGLGGVPVAYGLFMEFLPSENRGARLSYIEAFWTLGSMLESALAWIVLPRHSWRVLLLISAAPLLGLIACIFIVPESVLYSVNAGRMEEAKETLRRVAATNGKSLPQGELVGPNDRASSSGEFEDRTSYGMGASGVVVDDAKARPERRSRAAVQEAREDVSLDLGYFLRCGVFVLRNRSPHDVT